MRLLFRLPACLPACLQNTGMHTHLPPWVLHLPVQKLWLASNQLSALLPPKVARVTAGRGLVALCWLRMRPAHIVYPATHVVIKYRRPLTFLCLLACLQMSAAAYEARQREWLGRLTHVCLSSNALREIPVPLLQHATGLVELDLAYNHSLQITAKAADQVALLGRWVQLRVSCALLLLGSRI